MEAEGNKEEDTSVEVTAQSVDGVSSPCNALVQHDQAEDMRGLKRKSSDSAAAEALWKTSMCSYFRRQSQACKHGDNCRFAHGEHELRPRPDNSWDPTSDRAKKFLQPPDGDEQHEESELCCSEDPNAMAALPSSGAEDNSVSNKCIVHLPRSWGSDKFKGFLNDLKLPYTNARKKKGMSVGFIGFACAEHATLATEKLSGKSVGSKHLKVADVLPRAWEKQQVKGLGQGEMSDQTMEDDPVLLSPKITNVNDSISLNSGDGDVVQNIDTSADRSILKPRTARDAVTPLAHIPYGEQLNHKKNSVIKILKKLTQNARKACPTGLPLPQWIASAKNQGGLPCKLEGILNSPLTNGYRNKCEFSVGYSSDGKRIVGFLLGNFREGITAVEEPTNCPNVSAIACQYASIFQNFVRTSEFSVWNKHQNSGFWRLFTVREGRAPNQVSVSGSEQADIGEVMLIVQVCSAGVAEKLRSSEFQRLAQFLVCAAFSASPPLPLTALFVQDHLGVSNAAPFDAPLLPIPLPKIVDGNIIEDDKKAPEGQIHDYISNLRFCISPTAFFQVNTLAAERLYSLAGDWAALSPKTLLFDVCCGTGTIGLTLAHRAGLVVGIEMNASAVSDAKRNAEINGVKNCRFVCAKAEDVMDALLNKYLDISAEWASDISESNSDKRVDNVQKEGTAKSENQDINASVATEPASIENKAVGGECKNLNNTSTSPVGISTETNAYVENVEETNVTGCFTDVDKKVDNIQEGTAETENQDIDVSVAIEAANIENKATGRECENLNISTSAAAVFTETNAYAENVEEANVIGRFTDVVVIVDPPRFGLHPVVIKAIRTHPQLRRVVYISCNPETLVANAIELCTPSTGNLGKGKGNRGAYRNMGQMGLARQRAKSMPLSEPFCPVKAMAVDLFPHTPHCEMVMLLER